MCNNIPFPIFVIPRSEGRQSERDREREGVGEAGQQALLCNDLVIPEQGQGH